MLITQLLVERNNRAASV